MTGTFAVTVTEGTGHPESVRPGTYVLDLAMWPAVAVSPTGGDGTAEGLWEGIRVTDSPNLKGITGGAEYTGVDLMTEMFAVARRGLEHLGNDDPFRPVVAAFVTDLGLRLDRSRLVAVLAEQPPPRG